MAPQQPRRPVRVANCSGALTDPAEHMYNQARYGHVDFITGDYLAEANMADSAAAAGPDRPKWIKSAFDGIAMSLDLINEKKIKVIVNGGCLDPKGMAEAVYQGVRDKGLKLQVAYVEGDDLKDQVHQLLRGEHPIPHLDHANQSVQLAENTRSFLQDPEGMPIVAANAYLGYRAIKRGLDKGADIIICGRVADASPVIAAAAWWHKWNVTDYDQLAGALIAGHLIECSTYVTGANFAGAHNYPVRTFVDIGCPIAEISVNGECVITKHEELGGFVTADTVKCQLLYELQGNIYLNSDVKADISDISIIQEGHLSNNRVHVSGVRGWRPPDTTKLAVFYQAGYQSEILLNASGYATDHKWDVQEEQVRERLRRRGHLDQLDVLEFQRVGVPMENPDRQLASTTYMRIFAQAKKAEWVMNVAAAWNYMFMAHFPGMHCSLDLRTVVPKPFLGYYPALVPQDIIDERVTLIGTESDPTRREQFRVGPPRQTQPIEKRQSYETQDPVSLSSFGPCARRPLGDIVLARSGDKGANVNIGLFVQTAQQWNWFRSFMTCDRLRELMGKDWDDSYVIERVEFPNIHAVHFVVYGLLGRGVSSSTRLDCLGKGFAEFIRAVHVPMPTKFLQQGSRL